MTFEHEKTRQSLQLAFETIFAKFDCSFSDDDEVDIEELRVVKKGKTLRQAPVRPFGSVFRREHDHSTLSDENSETDDGYTTVDDDEYLRSMHRDLVGKDKIFKSDPSKVLKSCCQCPCLRSTNSLTMN